MDDVLAEELEPLIRSGAEPRAHEDRVHEPAADDEPLPDARIRGEDVPMPGLLDLDEIEARSHLAASLRPSAFPATRSQLIAVATEEHASQDVLDALHTLPPRRRFVHVQQVWEALGGERERRGAAVPHSEPAAVAPKPEVRQQGEPQPPVPEPLRSEPALSPPAEPAMTNQSVPEWAIALCGDLVHAGFVVMTVPIRLTIGAARAVYQRVVQPEAGP
jgi:hypothetical protein